MADRYNFFESSSHSLFRRCVQCPSDPPSCPQCGPDETCSLKAPSCDACASTTCVKIGSLPGQLATKSSPPIGAIVGGVVGGVVALAVIAYIVWRFWLRPRHQAMFAWQSPEKRDLSTLHRGDRQSTRSGHSIASTALTRASNVIQIAYIPGVTVRSPPESPALLGPPASSIRSGTARSSTRHTPNLEQHFFMPGDLRDSTWSEESTVDRRISLAPSLARTTLYHDNEIVPPIPAQQAYRAQANVVSVKTAPSTPIPNRTPQIPQTTSLENSKSRIVARNVTAKPIEVKKPGPRVPTLANLALETSKKSHASASSEKSVPVYIDEKEVVMSPTNTIIDDSPMTPTTKANPTASFDHGSTSSGVGHSRKTSTGLNAMIENALTRASDPHLSVQMQPLRPTLRKHDSGPFSDSNEVKENLP